MCINLFASVEETDDVRVIEVDEFDLGLILEVVVDADVPFGCPAGTVVQHDERYVGNSPVENEGSDFVDLFFAFFVQFDMGRWIEYGIDRGNGFFDGVCRKIGILGKVPGVFGLKEDNVQLQILAFHEIDGVESAVITAVGDVLGCLRIVHIQIGGYAQQQKRFRNVLFFGFRKKGRVFPDQFLNSLVDDLFCDIHAQNIFQKGSFGRLF